MAKETKKDQQKNIKYLYNTRRYLFFTGMVVGLFFLLILFSLIPQINSVRENYSDMIAANKRLAQLQLKANQLEQSENSLIINNVDRVNQVLPSRKPLLELLTGLNSVGSGARVEFTDIQLTPGNISTGSAELAPTRSTNRANYEVLNLTVRVTGGLDNINSFLERIENLAPFSTVTSLSLNERTNDELDESPIPLFDADVTISTYFFTREISSNLSAALPQLSPAQEEVIGQLQNFTFTSVTEQNQIQGGGLENLFPGIESIPISL